MNRRDFSRKLAVGGIFGPAVLGPMAAVASEKKSNSRDNLAPLGRVRLKIGGRFVVPNELRIIGDGNAVKVVNLNREYLQTREKRGFLRGFSSPTIKQRYAGARRSGQVRIDAKILYVNPEPIDRIDFEGATLVNNGISWEIGGLGKVDYQTTDRIPVLGKLPVVGELFRQESGDMEDNLLITITPTLVKLPE